MCEIQLNSIRLDEFSSSHIRFELIQQFELFELNQHKFKFKFWSSRIANYLD